MPSNPLDEEFFLERAREAYAQSDRMVHPKSSLASPQSICASIAAANCGMALSREKSRTGMIIL